MRWTIKYIDGDKKVHTAVIPGSERISYIVEAAKYAAEHYPSCTVISVSREQLEKEK